MAADLEKLSDGVEGGIAATNPPRAPLTLLAAPATGKEFNTLQARIFPLACWRVENIRFDFDSSFVRPEIAVEMQHLIALIQEHSLKVPIPGTREVTTTRPAVSIFGHADPVGNDDYNKQLAGRRAQAIYGLLTRKTALWEDLFSHPLGGDKWGDSAINTMRTTLGQPASTQPTTAGERKLLYSAFMDKICIDEAGQPFTLAVEDFLGAGADAGGKADFQGCGEFNPLMMFSREESEKFAKPENKIARDIENAASRRVLAFLFRPGIKIDPSIWPCPRAKEGVALCKKRFWSDAEKRRKFQDERREFEKSLDTFACRFYQRLTHDSPCERFLRLPLEVLVHVQQPDADPGDERLVAVNNSGAVSRAFRPQDRARNTGVRHFIIGPGILPNPVELRWREGEHDIHVAGPCDPLKLRDALVESDLQTGQTLIGQDREPAKSAGNVTAGNDLGKPEDQAFAGENEKFII